MGMLAKPQVIRMEPFMIPTSTVHADTALNWAGNGRIVYEASGSDSMSVALQRLQSLLVNVNNVELFLQEAAELAAGVVEPPASCGITIQRDGQPITVASSDDQAALLDETQYQQDDGPCLQAMRTGHPVYVRDVGSERRWPPYIKVARQHGLQSSYSMPMMVRGESLGAVNTYAFHSTDAFDDDQKQRLAVFSAQAAGAFQLVSRNTRNTELLEQLERALTSRTVIDQALGIIMGQQQCSADEAFALLRAQSQNHQHKLRDVAANLVTNVSGQPPQSGKAFDTSD